MAKGIGEDPSRSPSFIIQQVEYPATRDEIVETAGDATPEVINFLKALPKPRYQSYEECLRDFAEAERRFGTQRAEGRSRENLNRVDPTHHP